MAEEKIERFQGSFNYVTDLNKSFNTATSLLQTVSQSQSIITGDTGNRNSSSKASGGEAAPAQSTDAK